MTTLQDFTAPAPDGSEVDLSAYAGQVVLVVNTATGCGYTPQLRGLQELQDRFGDRGFSVLGFPSDQFKQEPLADGEIGEVCQRDYGVAFPLFAKIAVNGKDAHPLYRWLRSQKRGVLGGRVNWNFTKFLVDRDGAVVNRYGPTTEPSAIADDVEALLGSPAA